MIDQKDQSTALQISSYAWLNEYNQYLSEAAKHPGSSGGGMYMTDLMRISKISVSDILKFVGHILNHPEIVLEIKNQIEEDEKGNYPKTSTLLPAFARYYAWKNSIDRHKIMNLEYGFSLARKIISGEISNVDSEESIKFLIQFPEVYQSSTASD